MIPVTTIPWISHGSAKLKADAHYSTQQSKTNLYLILFWHGDSPLILPMGFPWLLMLDRDGFRLLQANDVLFYANLICARITFMRIDLIGSAEPRTTSSQ
jgi:hypothetical protein